MYLLHTTTSLPSIILKRSGQEDSGPCTVGTVHKISATAEAEEVTFNSSATEISTLLFLLLRVKKYRDHRLIGTRATLLTAQIMPSLTRGGSIREDIDCYRSPPLHVVVFFCFYICLLSTLCFIL